MPVRHTPPRSLVPGRRGVIRPRGPTHTLWRLFSLPPRGGSFWDQISQGWR